uniref:tRNA/rRNA methyltransferase SpoU type domain-containing protein n=1 Tax=Varanus komodoensis TaxID=61221 RepID=A0A8D2LVA4_VARKO
FAVFELFSCEFQEAKSEQGWEILGTTGHGKTEDGIPLVNSLDFCWTRPSVLVLGSEGDGLSPETRRLCHRMLTISPGRKLPPGIESLNVSVAAGILLHSICSQKKRHHEDLISIKISVKKHSGPESIAVLSGSRRTFLKLSKKKELLWKRDLWKVANLVLLRHWVFFGLLDMCSIRSY